MKAIIADFSTEKIDLVKLKVKQDEAIDKEVGTMFFHKDDGQAQYYIDKEISGNQGVVDVLAESFRITFLNMQAEGIIKDLNVYIVDVTDEDLKKVIG